jgi:hypothetical protein
MNTITIESSSKADYQLFIGLAKRLKAKFSVNTMEEPKTKKESKLSAFFGAFGDIDSDEMIKNIEESRTISSEKIDEENEKRRKIKK